MINHGGQIAKPMIHGLYGHRLQIVNHGILHRDQDWGIEHAPDISPWAGSQVEIYTRSPACDTAPLQWAEPTSSQHQCLQMMKDTGMVV